MTGPVQLLVVGFEEASFSGAVLAELDSLRAQGVVRLIDVLLVRRDADGSFDTLPPPPGTDPAQGRIAAEILSGDPGGDTSSATSENGWSLADSVEPGGLAAVALLEHLWAQPLVAAIEASGGRPLGELWLSPEDRARIPD